ncbi:MAG: squalene/phytoene synthase family protein [Planctomycetaceae bacterium]|nr:squalene/phytoene synthase family protein [Planctomycetaceae bacterium]
MNSSSNLEPRIQELLTRTSRTFALAIPLLPPPVRLEVSVAYLLFRVADTVEDGRLLTTAEKLEALDRLNALLTEGDFSVVDRAAWLSKAPCDDQDCLDLLDDLPLVLAVTETLDPQARAVILKHVCASIVGMKQVLEACDDEANEVRLESLDDLRNYCYHVAGLVGEMLTELFLLASPELHSVRLEMEAQARWFGEGLQLVNILKDSEVDRSEGRHFIPATVPRTRLLELAREDLGKATVYVSALRQAKAPGGFLAFTNLPLQLAWRTLECVEQLGPGSKVPRAEVVRIMNEVISQFVHAENNASQAQLDKGRSREAATR